MLFVFIALPAIAVNKFAFSIVKGNINVILPDWVVTIIMGTIGFIFEFIVIKLCYTNWFCELKIDKIEEREKKKLEKKYALR